MGKQDADQRKDQCQHDAGHDRAVCVAGGAWSVVMPQRLADLDLSAHLGKRGQTVGKPHEHAGSTDCGHRIGTDASDPDHIDQVVGHLDQAGGHDRCGERTERRKDRPFQQIDISVHVHSPDLPCPADNKKTVPWDAAGIKGRSLILRSRMRWPGSSSASVPSLRAAVLRSVPRPGPGCPKAHILLPAHWTLLPAHICWRHNSQSRGTC